MPTKKTKRTLYLIDGHAQIFRAYYAIQSNMTSPVTGEPTGASFAFTSMLYKFFEQHQPEHVVMAIDMPGKTFRHDLYEDYKANRESPPEDFVQQLPRIFEITKRFGIKIIGVDGYEADDVIATIADQTMRDPALEDVQVMILSRDKDLEQLLTPRVAMLDLFKEEVIDLAALEASKGIKPEEVVELQSLTGDSVDNIPGVEGIGAKTGIKLIQEYGTVDNLLAHIDEIKGKRKEKILAAKDMLPVYRDLVTLKRDLDLDYCFDDAAVQLADTETLRTIFKDLGFRRHITDLTKLGGKVEEKEAKEVKEEKPPADGLFAPNLFTQGNDGKNDGSESFVRQKGFSATEDYDYKAIKTKAELDGYVKKLDTAKSFAIDTETVGLGHRTDICGICLSYEAEEGVYVPTLSPQQDEHLDTSTVLKEIKKPVQDRGIEKLGHNLKYDYLVLRQAGVKMEGPMFDSMIAAWLTEQPGLSMDHLAYALLQHEATSISELIDVDASKGKKRKSDKPTSMEKVPLEQITKYAAEDADLTLRLCHLFKEKLEAQGLTKLAETVEMPLVKVLAEMEYAGIKVDPVELDKQREGLEKRVVELRDQIIEKCGLPFNVDSPKQLGEVLFEKLKFPVIRKTKTGASTSAEVLEKLCELDDLPEEKRAIPKLIVEYRQLNKLVNTYLVNLKEAIEPDTGRIHASFNQTGTATGRLSSSNPNLQNIPVRTDVGREIRRAFVAEKDHVLVSADYSQIELRVLAHLSQDQSLLSAFRSGADIHAAVAANVFGVPIDEVTSEQRGRAKTINFGIIYGITSYGLARRIEALSQGEAKQLIDDYNARFPGIEAFLSQCVQDAISDGYVKTMLGRRRSIPQITSRNGQTRALGERLAINSVVQGSAADLIKVAMVNLHQRIEKEKLPMRLLLQIHDELIIECPLDQCEAMGAILKEEMEGAMSMSVPLEVEVGSGASWYEAK
ncbi:DNA polymerase I [Poriferisphaera sp. WC338]|uniref:DNA polymerase I n=1 Tax=Poriferisphaera sp. WC338 TaxID=3425129 RepID=UPI003D8134E1